MVSQAEGKCSHRSVKFATAPWPRCGLSLQTPSWVPGSPSTELGYPCGSAKTGSWSEEPQPVPPHQWNRGEGSGKGQALLPAGPHWHLCGQDGRLLCPHPPTAPMLTQTHVFPHTGFTAWTGVPCPLFSTSYLTLCMSFHMSNVPPCPPLVPTAGRAFIQPRNSAQVILSRFQSKQNYCVP